MDPSKKDAMQAIINSSRLSLNSIYHDLVLLTDFDNSLPVANARKAYFNLATELRYLRDKIDEL